MPVSSPGSRTIASPSFQPHHLPLNTSERYWIALKGARLSELPLAAHGFIPLESGLYLADTPRPWLDPWHAVESLFSAQEDFTDITAAIIPSRDRPSGEDIRFHLKGFLEIQGIARSLWLGEALLAGRVICHFQPIVDGAGGIFGHEALARVQQADGSMISGYTIMAASRLLGLDYRLDRYLQQRAIESFAASGCEGRLFINFISGFIHRPEIYLDGIAHEIRRHGIPAGRIVLDLTRPDSQHNSAHLQAIADYCREQGYCIALDDIVMPEQAIALIEAIRPHYIKIDRSVTCHAEHPGMAARIADLVALARQHKAKVIGEGVESEMIRLALLETGVALFQGYHIGEPFAVDAPASAQAG